MGDQRVRHAGQTIFEIAEHGLAEQRGQGHRPQYEQHQRPAYPVGEHLDRGHRLQRFEV